MNFYSQLPELHHLTCRSLWDLTCVTFLYRWLFLCFTSSTLTVRSVPTGSTGRFSTPCVGSTHRRWLHHSTDLWGVRVRAIGCSPLQGDHHCTATPGPRRLVRHELCLLRFYYPRDRRVSHSPSLDELLWPQPHRGSSLRSGCFLLWVLTTRHGWTVWITYGSCYC
jgi:hypothetical protein